MKSKLLMFVTAGLVSTNLSYAQTWEQLPYYYPQTTQSTPKIFVSPNDVLVAGLNYNSAPASHISLDQGMTWQQIFPDKSIISAEFGPDGTIYFISNKKYLTTSNYFIDTLFTSTDGINWVNMGYKLLGGGTEYEFDITDNNTLLFTNAMNGFDKVFAKSTDNAISWTPTILLGNPITSSPNGDTIVTSFDSPWPGGVKYSHDGGITVNTATGISAENIPIRIPNGDIYAATIGQVLKSTDGGMTFTSILPSSIGQIHEFLYAANGKFYIRTLGGLGGAILETSDFVTFADITTSFLPDYAYVSDIDVSDNYVYAITDTNLYRLPLSPAVSNVEEIQTKMSVYPNPASDQINVVLSSGLLPEELILRDQSGRIVLQKSYSGTLELNQIVSGVYYLTGKTGTEQFIEKLIIK